MAAAAAARQRGAGETITVLPASGVPLEVAFDGESSEVILSGDARFVLEGEVGPEAVRGFPVD